MILRLVLNIRSVEDTTTYGDSIGPTGAIRFVTGEIGNLELDTFVAASPVSLDRPGECVDDIPCT